MTCTLAVLGSFAFGLLMIPACLLALGAWIESFGEPGGIE